MNSSPPIKPKSLERVWSRVVLAQTSFSSERFVLVEDGFRFGHSRFRTIFVEYDFRTGLFRTISINDGFSSKLYRCIVVSVLAWLGVCQSRAISRSTAVSGLCDPVV